MAELTYEVKESCLIITDPCISRKCDHELTGGFTTTRNAHAASPTDIRLYEKSLECSYTPNMPLVRYDPFNNVNRFLMTMHEAYDKHLPLEFSVADVWIMICHGIAKHVEMDPEAHRSWLVQHGGTKTINITEDDFTEYYNENDWPSVIHKKLDEVKNDMDYETHKSLLANFNDHNDHNCHCASSLDLLCLVQNYYEYKVTTNCGIPKIILHGHKEDWDRIRGRVYRLGNYGLEWWRDRLLPVIDKIIAAYKGEKDDCFWRRIYMYRHEPGTDANINGWVNCFFPYIIRSGGPPVTYERNPLTQAWNANICAGRVGNCINKFPVGVCVFPFTWVYKGVTKEMEYLTGFMGSGQESCGCAIKPIIGWMVRRKVK